MKNIEYLKFELTPYVEDFPVTGRMFGKTGEIKRGSARLHFAKVSMQVNGTKHQIEMPVNNDDMTTRFDLFIDMMRDALRAGIEKAE